MYWIGSRCVACLTNSADFGLICADKYGVAYATLVSSYDEEYEFCFGVLPVIALKSNVIINSQGIISK